jgi:probable phosphoglycerate mutase
MKGKHYDHLGKPITHPTHARFRSKKGRIILWMARHGRAVGNAKHILNGSRIDAPLTALGHKQAKELARRWKEKPDIIITSPMKRARQTAAPLAKKYGVKPIIVSELSEQDCGNWTGQSSVKMVQTHPNHFFPYPNGRMSHYLRLVPGGENWAHMRRRARRVLATITDTYAGKKVMIVAHGGIVLACVSLLSDIRPPQLWTLRLKNGQAVKFIL